MIMNLKFIQTGKLGERSNVLDSMHIEFHTNANLVGNSSKARATQNIAHA